MKKGMFAMAAALSFAVVAQDAEGPKARQRDGGFRHGPRDRGAMMAERGMMMPGGGMPGGGMPGGGMPGGGGGARGGF